MDPLDESYDPLDESFKQEDLDFVKGGSCPDEGFAASAAETRKRASRLNSLPDDKKIVSQAKKRAFLAAFSQTGIVSMAAAAAGLSVSAIYRAKKTDPDFAEMWATANEVAGDMIDLAIFQRAVHGVQKDIWHKGRDGAELIGHETVYSDNLLALLAKARKPEVYRERFEHRHDTENKGGVLLVPGVMPMDEWSLAALRQQAQYREAPPEE